MVYEGTGLEKGRVQLIWRRHLDMDANRKAEERSDGGKSRADESRGEKRK